jgi:hypothetical protein
MPTNYYVNQTALNRLQVALGDNAITPTAGNSVDGQGSAGELVIGTSSLTPNSSTGVLVTITLQFPSFTYAVRTASLAGVPLSAVASASGTAVLAELRDHNGNTIINGLLVGLAGSQADIIINTTTIQSGQTITCIDGTITG